MILVYGLSKKYTVDRDLLERYLLDRSTRDGECLIIEGFGPYRDVYQKVAGNAWAHQVAHAVWIGPLVKGLDVHHTCNRRDCIEPTHLRQITHKENCRAGVTRETCAYGHPREPEDPVTGRYIPCKPCGVEASRSYQRRRKQAILTP